MSAMTKEMKIFVGYSLLINNESLVLSRDLTTIIVPS